VVNRRRSELTALPASAEEVTAIMAALERFERDAEPPRSRPGGATDRWTRAAILEGVSRKEDEGPGEPGAGDPWINT
jgi:hypothetical protein